jgi:hypothetical protein
MIDRMLRHVCTLRKWTPGEVDEWGQYEDKWTDYATVRCLLQAYGARRDQAEVVNRYTDAAQVEWYVLFMPYRPELLAAGAEQAYQVAHVKDARGNVVHAGPLDIRLVMNAGGQQHHLEVVVVSKP